MINDLTPIEPSSISIKLSKQQKPLSSNEKPHKEQSLLELLSTNSLRSKPLKDLLVCPLSGLSLKNNLECKSCHALFNADALSHYLNNNHNNSSQTKQQHHNQKKRKGLSAQKCPNCQHSVKSMKDQFTHNSIIEQLVSRIFTFMFFL